MSNKCPNCGKPVPTSALQGLCPECMLQLGAASQTDTGGEPGPHGTKVLKPPPTLDEIARHFPQFEILECLGRGGMGVVYKARQPRLDRLVALKILAPEKEKDPQFAERFAREAKALARLNHPNIVTVHDFGEADGLFYLMMEYVDGASLRQLIRTRKLTPPEALAIVPKICEALQFAHDKGVVHRDIKPENVLVDTSGQVKIADFGIAKIVGETGRAGSPLPADTTQPEGGAHGVTRPTIPFTQDQILGTPNYMAPEQMEKPQLVDHRADIYSLGVVFYEMLTGELPLGKFQPPSKKVQVDVRLDEVVLHALEKEPERRYQHVSEVKSDVETIAASPSPQATTADSSTMARRYQLLRWKSSFFFFAAACLFVATGLIGLRGEAIVATYLSLMGCVGFSIAGYRHLRAAQKLDAAMRASQPAAKIVSGVRRPLVPTGLTAILVGTRGGERVINWPGVIEVWLLISVVIGFVVFGWGQLIGLQLSFWASGVMGLVFGAIVVGSGVVGSWSVPKDKLTPLDGITPVVPNAAAPSVDESVLAKARQEVKHPASWLVATGILNWIAIPFIVMVILPYASRRGGTIAVTLPLLAALFLSSAIILAGLKMKRLEAYSLAVMGSILAIFITPGNIIGLPVGIWCLVVLCRREVREAFAKARTLPSATIPTRGGGAWKTVTAFAAATMILLLGLFGLVLWSRTGSPASPTGIVSKLLGREPRNPVQLDSQGQPIATHDMQIWSQDPSRPDAVTFALEDRGYSEMDKVVARIGELMRQKPFPFIRVRVGPPDWGRGEGQKLIAELAQRCREIGFLNLSFRYDLMEAPDAKVPADVTFGPVIERVVNDVSTGRDCFLNLGTGEVLSTDVKLTKWEDMLAWSKRHVADVVAETDGNSGGQRGLTLFEGFASVRGDATPDGSKFWNESTAETVIQDARGTETALAKHPERLPFSKMRTDGKTTPTFVFKTRHGKVGLLQILALTDNPRGVKLRYKLVQNAEPKPSTASPVEPAAQDLSFSPVWGSVIHEPGEDLKDCFMDVDSHRSFRVHSFSAPKELVQALWPRTQLISASFAGTNFGAQWARTNGVDLMKFPGEPRLVLLDGYAVSSTIPFDDQKADEVVRLTDHRRTTLDSPGPGLITSLNLPPDPTVRCWLFRTREGHSGVLEFEGFDDKSHGARIRGKLALTHAEATRFGLVEPDGSHTISDLSRTWEKTLRPPVEKADSHRILIRIFGRIEDGVGVIELPGHTNTIYGVFYFRGNPSGEVSLQETVDCTPHGSTLVRYTPKAKGIATGKHTGKLTLLYWYLPNETGAPTATPATGNATTPRVRAGLTVPSAFGPASERTITTGDADGNGTVAIRFKNNELFKPPSTLTAHFKDPATAGFTPVLKQWMQASNADLLFCLRDKGYYVMSFDMRAGWCAQPTEWETIMPDKAFATLSEMDTRNTARTAPAIYGATGYRDGLAGVQCFRTRENLVGVYQLRGVDDLSGRGVQLRYKLVQNAELEIGITSSGAVAADNLSFGPVIERVIQEGTLALGRVNLTNSYINFESGEVLSVAENDKRDIFEINDSLQRGGMDVTCKAGLHGAPTLTSAGQARFAFLPDQIESQITADEVLSVWSSHPHTESTLDSDDAHLPQNYIVKTAEGNFVLLQITSFTENPRGVKIRYKVMQYANTSPSASNPKAIRETSTRERVSKKTTPAAVQNLSFGPVNEQLVSGRDADKDGFILFDLETGKTSTPPLPFTLLQRSLKRPLKGPEVSPEFLQWAETNNFDLLFQLEEKSWSCTPLAAKSMKGNHVFSADLEKTPVDEVTFVAADENAGGAAWPAPVVNLDYDDQFRSSSGFITRTGTRAIVQYKGINTTPRSVQIRYKLVKNGGDPANPSGASLEQTSSPAKRLATGEFSQDFQMTVPLAAKGRFSLDNPNGSVEITGWEGNTVLINGVKRGRNREAVEATRIDAEPRADQVGVRTILPRKGSGWGGASITVDANTRENSNMVVVAGGTASITVNSSVPVTVVSGGNDNVSVDYKIQVPRAARLEKIENANGSVVIEGVTGDITAASANGSVRVTGAKGNLKLSTSNGKIIAEPASLGGRQLVSLDTSNGSISLAVPSDADATVTADTTNGSITSEFPALKVKKDFPTGNHLNGTLGAGSANVKMRTANGSITIRRGSAKR